MIYPMYYIVFRCILQLWYHIHINSGYLSMIYIIFTFKRRYLTTYCIKAIETRDLFSIINVSNCFMYLCRNEYKNLYTTYLAICIIFTQNM